MLNWTPYLPIMAVALWIVASMAGDRKRAAIIVILADRLGLHRWGDTLPPELNLAGTPMARAHKTWNVIEGQQNGMPVIAFDCQMGAGKGSWRRTVIAAKSDHDVFTTVPSESSYTVDYCGGWAILYAPKRGFIGFRSLMPLAELEARLTTIESS